jgi:hypothetical protein
MLVHGSDCSIVIKTAQREMDVPYSDETLREAVSILKEEASIEGDGVRRGIRKISGVTGCVVSPLTIGTAPFLLYLAMGAAGVPLYVSETRNLFKYELNLLPTEDTEYFDLIQDRRAINSEQLTMNNERKLYEGCRVKEFELRILRGEAIKLKMDICGECVPRTYQEGNCASLMRRPTGSAEVPYTDIFNRKSEERFNSDYVTYRINGQEYSNIYGITLLPKKQGGTNTKLWIKRALQQNGDILAVI